MNAIILFALQVTVCLGQTLSTGAIGSGGVIGMVIGLVLLVAILIIPVYWYCFNRKAKQRKVFAEQQKRDERKRRKQLEEQQKLARDSSGDKLFQTRVENPSIQLTKSKHKELTRGRNNSDDKILQAMEGNPLGQLARSKPMSIELTINNHEIKIEGENSFDQFIKPRQISPGLTTAGKKKIRRGLAPDVRKKQLI